MAPTGAKLAPLATKPIFSEEFAAPRLDATKWQVTGDSQTLHRTQWGHIPELLHDGDGTTFMRLSLQTYNPNPEKKGRAYLGTQLVSVDRWNRGTGIEYEARLRANSIPQGLVLGYFSYGDAGQWKASYQKTETDFEFLSTQGNHTIQLSAWDNWNPLRPNASSGLFVKPSRFNWNDSTWNDYKIRWYPDRTEWIVNDVLVSTEREIRPGSPMGVWFNIWAPNPDWTDAFSDAITPTSRPDQNKIYTVDVDYVRVRPIPASPHLALGKGSGLMGVYYDSEHFTHPKLTRVDPRVDFNWGKYAPDSSMKPGAFSVRWSGFVEAQHSQQYTFTTYTDDGVRLWVNNKLLIDHWRLQSLSAASGKIKLQAGVKVPIRLEYFDHAGGAWAQLYWSSASTPRQLVPQSQLYVPAQPQPPVFSPAGGSFWKAKDVVVKSPSPNTLVRYTLDGTAPTSTSPLLKPGATLRVCYTQLVRARAFAPGQAPSESAKAAFLVHDTTPPLLDITAPSSLHPLPNLQAVSGHAFDEVSGVKRIDVIVTRLTDGLCWKHDINHAGVWVNEEWGMPATINGDTWSVTQGLPAGTDLSPGSYELKAVAYDYTGNIAGNAETVNIVPAAPLSYP